MVAVEMQWWPLATSQGMGLKPTERFQGLRLWERATAQTLARFKNRQIISS